jgi:MATE family multidrug resistance protein
MGIGFYCSTFVAQYFGANEKEKMGAIVWQGIWLGLLCIPVYLVIGIFGEQIFTAIGHDPKFCKVEHAYFLALSFGAGAVVLDAAVSSFFVGQGKTGTVMYVNIFGATLNLVLDYWFIFGGLGVPEMGIWGAGLATSIAGWTKILIFLWLFFLPRFADLGTRTHWRLDISLMKRFLYFGLPNGLQFCIEGLAVTFFFVVIPTISADASAAASLVFSINMLIIFPVFGLGMGCSTLVGQKIGEKLPDLASRATWTALGLGLVYTALFSALYFLTPSLFFFAHETDNGEFLKIKPLVILYLKFVALYCIFDTVQIIFVSAIKGAGDTRFVVVVTIVTALLFVGAGSYGATLFDEPNAKVNWWWGSLTGWILLLSVVYWLRFRQGKWRNMSVIEDGTIAVGN